MDLVLQIIISGLLLGGIYALISIGLNIIFGVIKIVNLAHGDFLMMAMYAAFFLFTLKGIDPFVGVFIIFPAFVLLGVFIFRVMIKPLLGTAETEVNTIIATAGLGFVLQNLALMLWKSDIRAMETSMTGQSYEFFGIMLSSGRTWAFIVCLIVALLLYYVLMYTKIGTHIRAVSQDTDAATLMGINVDKIYTLTFAIGIGLVGVAGAIIAPTYNMYPTIGLYFNTMAFIIVVLGGLGSFTGALIGGLIIGLVEAFAGVLASAELAQVFSLLIFLVILFIRPEGIMGKGARV
ncbi:MAG TPA: branched-chain amino acid ABC transporter permease [Syntrophomonadaceae bacterium]|nr:branched-chain amino acid ABC transporter permease [Syntrophomonadaceae bacterium]HQA07665.1 branched-chain amino acid ABC transporter permease [Syntrophomonadaceae bacterium]HQE22928.1 branched-chain amino acid ABC transporter permease [Syntrophomonadaceae bacterium]